MNKIGLYIHVPFCRIKCRYCDFYSTEETAGMGAFTEKTLSFLPALAEEAEGRRVDTVYFGGGTPSLLPPESVTRLMEGIFRYFSVTDDAEITAEANPESLTDEALSALRGSGFNRLSLGMQSADDGELALLGRVHTHADTVSAVERAKKGGFENVSLDLMYALPDQKKDAFLRSLSAALSLSPAHLSFYALTLSEKAPMAELAFRQPGEEEQLETYLAAVSLLEEAGFRQYEISNAARPGFESRHNLRYWKRKAYLGVGPGAWSYFEGERFGMAKDLHRFLAAKTWRDAIAEREKIGRAQEIEEEIVLSLRLSEGLNGKRLLSLAGKDKTDSVLSRLAKLEKQGFASETENGYRLTPRGFFVSNAILADLI